MQHTIKIANHRHQMKWNLICECDDVTHLNKKKILKNIIYKKILGQMNRAVFL